MARFVESTADVSAFMRIEGWRRVLTVHNPIILVLLVMCCLSGCTEKTAADLCSEGIRQLQRNNPAGAIVLFRNALDKDQNLLDARHQLARAYMAAGKLDLAEKELQKIKRLNPARKEYRLELAQLYNTMNQPNLAIKEAESYLELQPESTDALEVIGVAYGLKNNLRESEAFLVRAMLNEQGYSATIRLAELYASQGKHDQGEALLGDVIASNPENIRAHHLLAEMELSAGRKKEALVIYRKIEAMEESDPDSSYRAGLLCLELGNVPCAESTASNLLKKFPKNAEGNRLKGIILYRNKNYQEAITALQAANKLLPTASGSYLLGLSLYANKEPENALSQFRLVLDTVPSFHQARLLSGMLLLKLKRYDDAIAELRKLIEQDPGNAMAHNLLGSTYLAKGMYDQGMKELNKAALHDPKLVDTYLKKGIIHLSQGKTADVETDLVTAIKVAPELFNTRLILASFYMQKNDSEKAFATLREGLKGKRGDAALYLAMAKVRFAEQKPKEAIHFLQKSKNIDPGSVDPYFTLALYHAANGNTAPALKEYQNILVKQPDNVKAMLDLAALLESAGRNAEAAGWYLKARETRKPSAYLALAQHFEKRGRAGEALGVLKEASRSIPGSLEVLEGKARLQLKLRQHKEALDTIEDIESLAPENGLPLRISALIAMNKLTEATNLAQRAINLKPDSSRGYMLLASVYQEQGQIDRAINELKKEISRNGNDPQVYLLLAGLHGTGRDHAQALKVCSDALSRFPNYAPAWYSHGTFLERQGKFKGAVNSYRSAMALSGDYALAMNNLAYLYAQGYGNREEAVRMATTAAALEPENPRILDTLGYALLKSGKHQEAVRVLIKAESLKPGDPTINYHLALAHKAAGEKRQAISRLNKALDNREFADARQARNLLSELN